MFCAATHACARVEPNRSWHKPGARAALKMESVLAALVEEERARFPSGAPRRFVYGTAGFREK